MYRIDNTSAVPTLPVPGLPGTPGFFTDGNPAAALEATIVDAWWANIIQEEILTVVTRAGLTPRKDDNTQLWQALNALFAAGGNFLPLAGGVMTGFITLHAPPAQPMHAANRQYVDDAVNAAMSGTGYVPEAPPGPLTYGRLNAAWNPVLPLAGGTLSGPLTTSERVRIQRDGSGLFWISGTGMPEQGALGIRLDGSGQPTEVLLGKNATFQARAALRQIDLGQSQSNRHGYFDGDTGNAALDGNLTVGSTGSFGTVSADVFNRPNVFTVNATQFWLANSITAWPTGGGRLVNTWECTGYLTVNDFRSNGNVYLPNGYVTIQHSYEPELRLTGPSRTWIVMTRNDGYFLVGTNNPPAGRFTIEPTQGYTNINGALDVMANLYVRGSRCERPGGGAWDVLSDRRLKQQIKDYSGGLEEILQLRPVSYRYSGRGGLPSALTYYGIIADEAEEAMPELIVGEEEIEGEAMKLTNEGPVLWALVNAVRELTARLAVVERRMDNG